MVYLSCNFDGWELKNNPFIRLTVNFYAVWWLIVDPGIETLLAAFEQLEPDTPLTETFFFL